MIRLLKPIEHYKKKYGTDRYALNKLYLMMEKEHNRGQEGAGIACSVPPMPPREDGDCEYMFRERAEGKDAVTEIFKSASNGPNSPSAGGGWGDAVCFMGHLRYSTTGKSGLTYVHPFLRRNNWRAKNLCLCGNFNMTNIDEVFQKLLNQGMSPRVYSDTFTLLELMGHRLDREAERNFVDAKAQGLEGRSITDYIDSHMDMANVLRTTMPYFDGGYVICGLTGSGEMFSMRDPNGIRPAFYYADDEIVAIASERPVLQTTFDLRLEDVRELKPGEALIVNNRGEMRLEQIIEQKEYLPCSFERIYFSRGNDADIYQERKMLGRLLVPQILKAIDYDVANTVFSFIPNTAEVAYYGMLEGLREYVKATPHTEGHAPCVRGEKIVSKDIKLRTFITEGNSRNDLAAHVYDVTTGIVREGIDNLVVIDDSIVRGTTLRESIIRILNRLHPKKIIIVSSAPQIRYPDFYGIDMPRIADFIAYQAAAKIHEENLKTAQSDNRTTSKPYNLPTDLLHFYDGMTDEQISTKMVELLRPEGVTCPIEIVYQTVENMHKAIPNHPGDWYFTGHYPTPGGYNKLKMNN